MIILFISVFAPCFTSSETRSNDPDLETLTKIVCPAQRPTICLPYGACCRVSEFCHSGLCESCFPMSVPAERLLEWCRHTGLTNVTSMRHSSCRLACHDKFSDTLLSVCPKTLDVSRADDVKPQDSRECQECVNTSRASRNMWWAPVIGVISLIAPLTLTIFCLRRRRARNSLRKKSYKCANQDIREAINQVEQVTAALKCGDGTDPWESETVTGLVQSLQNQLIELSQVLKHRSQARGSVSTLSATAVLESSSISTALSRDFKVSQQKQFNDFV